MTRKPGEQPEKCERWAAKDEAHALSLLAEKMPLQHFITGYGVFGCSEWP